MTQLSASRYRRLTLPLEYGVSDGLYWDTTNSQLVLVIDDTIIEKLSLSPTSGKVMISDGTDVEPTQLSGDITVTGTGVTAIGSAKVTNAMLGKPRLRCVTETLAASTLTDGGAATGTKTLTAAVPAGARYMFTTCTAITGFTGGGQASCTITLGDGSDADRYNTGTPSVFTTAAAGVDMGVASGTAFHATAIAGIVATVTANADITGIIAGPGTVDLQFWFLEPI